MDTMCAKILADDKAIEECRGCNLAKYCSIECQKKDWISHKPACKIYGTKYQYNKELYKFVELYSPFLFITAFIIRITLKI